MGCIVCQRKAQLAANRERKALLKLKEEEAMKKNKNKIVKNTDEKIIETQSGKIDINKVIADRRAALENGKIIKK